MKSKKFALRSMLILGAIIALCLYFSSTIHSIFTAKVDVYIPKVGLLSQTHKKKCKLSYGKSFPYYKNSPDSVMIQKVLVKPGDFVKRGQPLFQCVIPQKNEIEEALIKEHQDALESALDFERRTANIRLSKKEKAYIEAYLALKKYRIQEYRAFALLKNRIPNFKKSAPNGADKEYSPEEQTLIRDWEDLDLRKKNAEEAFAPYHKLRLGYEAEQYLSEKQQTDTALSAAQNNLDAFYSKQKRVEAIHSPQEGYIVAVNVSIGDQVTDASLLCEISDGQPPQFIIRIDDAKLSLRRETPIEIKTHIGDFQSTITDIFMDNEGKKIASFSIPQEIVTAYTYPILQKMEFDVKFVTKTATAYYLLPTTALHGEYPNEYVFILSESENALGKKQYFARKLSVDVFQKAEGFAAVSNDLETQPVIYMEDRELKDNDPVMLYIK